MCFEISGVLYRTPALLSIDKGQLHPLWPLWP